MIRKLTLTAAQITLGKQKNMPHCLNSVKTASPRKISLKLGNWLLSYGQKRFSVWRPSAIVNFRNLEFMSRDLYGYTILHPCANFH